MNGLSMENSNWRSVVGGGGFEMGTWEALLQKGL